MNESRVSDRAEASGGGATLRTATPDASKRARCDDAAQHQPSRAPGPRDPLLQGSGSGLLNVWGRGSLVVRTSSADRGVVGWRGYIIQIHMQMSAISDTLRWVAPSVTDETVDEEEG